MHHTHTHTPTHTLSNLSQTESPADRGLSHFFSLLRLVFSHPCSVWHHLLSPFARVIKKYRKDKGLNFELSGYTSETAALPEMGEKGAFRLGPKSCPKPNPKLWTCWDGCQVLQPDCSEIYMSVWCSNMVEASIAFPSAGFQPTAAPSTDFLIVSDGKLTLTQTWNCWLPAGSSLNTHRDSWMMSLCGQSKAAYQIFLRSTPELK